MSKYIYEIKLVYHVTEVETQTQVIKIDRPLEEVKKDYPNLEILVNDFAVSYIDYDTIKTIDQKYQGDKVAEIKELKEVTP